MKFLVYSGGKKVRGDYVLRHFPEEGETGIFESLRTYRGSRIFREREHLERFLESAHTIGSPFSFSRDTLSRELRLAAEAFLKERRSEFKEPPDLFLRLSFWRRQIFVFVGQRQHAEALYERGVRLSTSPVRRTLTGAQSAQVKTSAYHQAFLTSLEVKPEGTYEWVVLDGAGCVTEVRVGNLFVVRRGALFTPARDGILNGVTRGVVIECAFRNRLRVTEGPLTRHDVYNAEEAFLTNTSWEILPVASLDGRRIGTGRPGPVTRTLRSTFNSLVQEEGP